MTPFLIRLFPRVSRPFPYFMAFVGTALCFVTTAFCLTQAQLVPPNRPAAPRGQSVLTANDAAINVLLKKLTLEEKIKESIKKCGAVVMNSFYG